MNVRIVDKAVGELSEREYDLCWKHNFGNWGLMRRSLVALRENNPERARAIMLFNGRNTLLGWALIFPSRRSKCAYFFIRKEYRRRGFGTHIAQYIRANYRGVTVCPSNKGNVKFFKTLPFKPAKGYEHVMEDYA